MNIGWLDSILYGLVAGITEFLPVSSQPHKQIILCLFGVGQTNSLLSLFVHIGCLLAILSTSYTFLQRLQREYSASKTSRRRNRIYDMQAVLDVKLVKTACVPLLFGFVIYAQIMDWYDKLPIISVFLVLNSIILLLPVYLPKGNKDSRNMSSLDGVLIGLGAMVSVFPGMSLVGVVLSIAVARGALVQQALKWSYLLCIPAFAIFSIFDLYTLIVGGVSGIDFLLVIQSLLAGSMAFLGGRFSIALAKAIAARSDFSNFTYYTWGVAMFTFILYLY